MCYSESEVARFAAPAHLRQPANLVSFETCGVERRLASDRAVLTLAWRFMSSEKWGQKSSSPLIRVINNKFPHL